MKHLLLLGAGRSASVLIDYLLRLTRENGYTLTIGDVSTAHLEPKLQSHPQAQAVVFDVHNEQQRQAEVSKADLVISLLPALYHPHVARACLALRRHLITASYVSPEIAALHEEAEAAGLLFLMEIGLDPGIDHLSAMKLIDEIKAKGGTLTSFKSYTGGLIAPESDNNPWHYKITWNPRNVVLAGQGTAKYIENGEYKYIPYHQLFTRTETLTVGEVGEFEGYANRDSLSYRQVYGLDHIPTLLRGTLRRPGYCSAWNVLVQLGLTDDTYRLEHAQQMTYRQFTEAYVPAGLEPLEERLAHYASCKAIGNPMERLRFLGLFDEEPIGLENPTPAQVVEQLLVKKWRLEAADKDMIVMQHQFEYELQGEPKQLTSSLVVIGDDPVNTAMAKTVGLPVGIAAKLLLQGRFSARGVVVPTTPAFYEPILAELEEYGVRFEEQEG